ncbi:MULTISPECIES: MarR family winged helix-turn-helix transcriptional regulator [unclassified Streptomyces]|uniref:MarR family winged helix-turn-helix transcriptional regulator n=1 Tax=Streptomyces TaxID=1883 RepID=UPI0010127895|nr:MULTISPECIES: MarR family winged helix-turn-helix transcriptional regulator [unclassified Streptomyces]MDT0424120.1 MarR family winged helix-turn-helix transcriptional regulator [Streptomyces sp. DSM 41859]NJA56790.1 winged helix-turn-helix transcriptional regulator [Streptomyces sp. NEAU-H3]WEH26056.1 MarR family winged helix-turn-helix transcriptional regulator [Streptomyces sp. AM 3-1-1]
MTEESLVDEHRSRPGLMLALLGAEAMRRLRAAHQEHDLTPRQFELLGLLKDRGDLPQGEVGHLMGVAPSVLVTQLNPLEAEGLVERRRDASDRRRHVVALTETGHTRLVAASRAQYEAEDALFASLGTEERAELQRLLARVRDDLTGQEEGCGTPGSLDRDRC